MGQSSLVLDSNDNSSDEERFIPTHSESSCSCPLIQLDENTINTLSGEDCTPLLVVKTHSDQAGGVELFTTTTKFGNQAGVLPFVAISHVRSERFGNSGANALPSCSLVQLQCMVDAVSGRRNTYFWIDTLCIPLETEDRKVTVNIRSIFESAEIVLVLCSSILESNATSGTQRLAVIRDSTWLSRLWTIQEGAVARKLVLQFATMAVDYDILFSDPCAADDAGLLLQLLGRMSDDVNSTNLRKYKQSTTRETSRPFSKTKLNLRKLLRIGYLCVPRFIHFASDDEKHIAMEQLRPLMSDLYEDCSGQSNLVARLNRLSGLAESAIDPG